MSQHVLKTQTKQGRPIEVMLGWDRPLQGYFMLITYLEGESQTVGEGQETEDPFLYNNLADEALRSSAGQCDTLDHFVRVLKELELAVPEGMLDAVRYDGELNVGNKFVDHTPATQSPAGLPGMVTT